MSSDPDTTRIVRSWLEAGPTALPDRVLDDVVALLPATPQRRRLWPAWRFRGMNRTVMVAIGAAAVVVAALVGGRILAPTGAGPGGPVSSPSPSPATSPTPAPSVQRLGNEPLDPGPVVATGFGESESVTFSFTVPDGWVGFGGVGVLPATGTEAPDGMGIVLGEVNAGLFSDPCRWAAGEPGIPVGPTVSDLAGALAEQTGYEASTPVDVSLGGYTGKRIDLQLPSDVASCDNGEFYPWSGSIYAQGPDNLWRVWILDVEGDRIVVVSTEFPGTSQADRAEQQAILDSMEITP